MGKHPLIRSMAWLMLAGLVVLSLVKLPAGPQNLAGGDKLLHFFSYFFLVFWFLHAYPAKRAVIVVAFVLLGIGLEVVQSLTPYRQFEWLDMLMNLSGVLAACWGFCGLQVQLKFLLCR